MACAVRATGDNRAGQERQSRWAIAAGVSAHEEVQKTGKGLQVKLYLIIWIGSRQTFRFFDLGVQQGCHVGASLCGDARFPT